MAEARTIELLLSNGSLSGLLRAELSKWNGVMLVSPRDSYSALSKQPEASFWGVYLLLSDDKVYIGQSSELLKRTKEHDLSSLNKDWWDRVVLLSTTNDWLNRSHIDYLESVLINKARKAGSLAIDNKKSGNTYKVSLFDEAKLNDYVDGALLLIELIGIKVFSIQENYIKKITVKTEPIDNKPISDKDISESYKMTKSKAVAIFSERKNIISAEALTFASLQEKEKTPTYWANPKPEYLKQDWYMILNDQIKREMHLLYIPKNTFDLYENGGNGFFVRADDGRLDINIFVGSLIEQRSKINLTENLIDTLRY